MKPYQSDLTQGSIWKQLILFAIPMMGTSLVQQLYTMVDAIVMGQCVGKSGLAAVDAVYNLQRLPTNIFVGVAVGATIFISQKYGAKQFEDLRKAIQSVTTFAALAGLLLSVVGVVGAPAFVRAVQVPAEIYPHSVLYTQICYVGFPFMLLYNTGASIHRAVGNSRTPFVALLIAGITNVVLDILLVGPVGWGVAGAAVATVVSQIVSVVLVYAPLMEENQPFQLRFSELRIDSEIMKSELRLGLPIGLQAALYPIANIIIQSHINRTGTDNIAAWALCGKLDLFLWLTADTLGAALSTFVAQNHGAGQMERAEKGVSRTILLTLGVILSIMGLLYWRVESILPLFITGNDADVIPLATWMFRFYSPLYAVYGLGEVFSGAIRGYGQTVAPMVIGICFTCLARIFWITAILPIWPGIETILRTYPITWILNTGAMAAYYFRFKAHHKIPKISIPQA